MREYIKKSLDTTFLELLALIFITLKLTNYIDWSWWRVLSPLWGILVALGILLLILGILTLANACMKNLRRK